MRSLSLSHHEQIAVVCFPDRDDIYALFRLSHHEQIAVGIASRDLINFLEEIRLSHHG